MYMDINAKILRYFSEYTNKYGMALQVVDILSLKHALEITIKWDSFFMKIKNYAYNLIDTNNNIILN